MKKITVICVKCDEKTRSAFGYEREMRVLKSNHSRFTEGTRFDFGFLQIASKQGYIIEILP